MKLKPASLLAACVIAPSAFAVPLGITSITTTNGDPAVVTQDLTNVTSFSNGGTNNVGLIAPTSVTGSANVSVGSVVYGTSGTSKPGLASTADLDVSNGLANVIQSGGFIDYQFGQLVGSAGDGNDIFLFELGQSPGSTSGDDAITVQGLDVTGALTGSAFNIGADRFGAVGKTLRFGINSDSESGASPREIVGVGFDVSDLTGASGVTGFRLSGSSSGIDPLAVGATIPEPASAALLAAGLGLLASRRRRA